MSNKEQPVILQVLPSVLAFSLLQGTLILRAILPAVGSRGHTGSRSCFPVCHCHILVKVLQERPDIRRPVPNGLPALLHGGRMDHLQALPHPLPPARAIQRMEVLAHPVVKVRQL